MARRVIIVERLVVGRMEHDVTDPNALKSAFAEFVSVLILVFAGQGASIAFNKVTPDGAKSPAGIIAASLAHGFGFFIGVSISTNISGGHVNPAVTFGAFLGGHISLLRGLLYWVGQLLGSTVACLLLKFCTNGITSIALSSGVNVWEASVFEIVMTFGLVYTVYATAIDPKKGHIGTIAPLAIGFIVAANNLAGAAFVGASMNPAVSFASALVSWDWASHWVYWAGPLIGGGIAAIIYSLLFISHETHEPLPSSEF
ncbi:hypothetical protein K2173_020968 [Erythroxylum novogranatense]|uniref:Uncharacterized protein n=1 Tax=Erythroxylum novogranatense TaxID=1862640 RepID=A0AAV8TMM3_9ROSI|nr:hypothetical protein K2173_020968 [Erythroxylum novogranatense]